MGFYSQTILQDSPIAYWRLGELSGTSAADVQGVASGTYGGAFTLGTAGAIAGDNNASAIFATGGTNGNVLLPNVSALNLGGLACTLECWAKTTLASAQHLIGGYNSSPSFGGYALGIGVGSGTGKVSYWSGGGNGGAWFESASAVNNGAWRHLAVVVSASATIIYIDGTADASIAADLRPTSFSGSRNLAARTDNMFPLIGSLDEVAIYSAALSAARIAAHYQAGIAAGMLAGPIRSQRSGAQF